MTEHIWLNGRLTAADEAAISPRAAAVLISSRGVYETLRVERNEPVRFAAHMHRLAAGGARLGLLPPDPAVLYHAVTSLLEAHSLTAARVRINITGGSGETMALVTCVPLSPLPRSQSLHTVDWRRNPHHPLAGIKYTACPENDLAQEAARAAGGDEALFLNTRGEVCEGAFSNLFAVIGGTVTTPPPASGCLPGVTRAAVLEQCRAHAIPCAERVILPEELTHENCTELFLTSSIRRVMPVHRLNTRPCTAPGPVTRAILAFGI